MFIYTHTLRPHPFWLWFSIRRGAPPTREEQRGSDQVERKPPGATPNAELPPLRGIYSELKLSRQPFIEAIDNTGPHSRGHLN